MVDRRRFETEAALLVGALGALKSRPLERGSCPDTFEDYALLSLLQAQAERVQDIGMDLLFPNRHG